MICLNLHIILLILYRCTINILKLILILWVVTQAWIIVKSKVQNINGLNIKNNKYDIYLLLIETKNYYQQ